MNSSSSATVLPATSQRPKRRLPLWLRRILWGLLAFIIILPIAGALFQAVATQIDRRRFPAPGQLVDIGGYKLHLYCLGDNLKGRPTVILEAGLGATSSAWGWVQPEIAKSTRVCAYDRAGMGWSEPSPAPRDAQHIAVELHTLLLNAQVPGPYVMAGWSYGGLYVRAYADQYPEDVAGLVLVDSSSPDQCTSTPAGQAQCASLAQLYRVAPFLSRFGVPRVIGLLQPPSGLPAPQNGALTASFAASKDWDTQSAEFRDSGATNDQVQASAPLGDKPLYVLTASDHGTPPDIEQLWQEWQTGFTALSTNSVQQVVPGSTHTSLIMDAAHAAVATRAILQVVEAARTGQALSSP